ncbi:MAG: hypothetical protein DRQ55_10260, partial [Planctomycetota bacterium]
MASATARADDWLLVRGSGDGVGSLSWERIGEAYLGSWSWREVPAEEADSDPATSRLMAGSPARHPAIAALMPQLGLALRDGLLFYDEQPLPQGVGLVLVRDDPDGAGLLVVFTGVDDSSAFQGFTTNVDLRRPGALYVRDGRQLSPRSLASFDTRSIELVPLDVLWWTAGAFHPERSLMDRALAVSRALAGYRFVYQAATIPEIDLLGLAAELLAEQGEAVDAAINLGFHHDVIKSALAREATLAELLGPRQGPHPVVYTLVAHPHGTNARSFGADPVTGRPALLLNLSALAGPAQVDAALMHELVHTRQAPAGRRLVDRVIHEGVAVLFVSRLEPADDAPALMWSEQTLEAARTQHDAIVSAVRELSQTSDDELITPWITLHIRPESHPDVP